MRPDRLMRDSWWFVSTRFIKKQTKVAAQIGPHRELSGSQCDLSMLASKGQPSIR
jgi:hypothetical protein